jgi:hypothetical protein
MENNLMHFLHFILNNIYISLNFFLKLKSFFNINFNNEKFNPLDSQANYFNKIFFQNNQRLNHKTKTLILFFLTLNINCAIGPVSGLVYSDITYPGVYNEKEIVGEEKTAEGCQYNFLGIITRGDAGAGSVALRSGIKKISTIDYRAISILTLVYRKYCTIVTGEDMIPIENEKIKEIEE